MDISVLSTTNELNDGQSEQFLAALEVKNTGTDPEFLGETKEEIAEKLGVSITDAPDGVSTEITFLYRSDDETQKQLDLQGMNMEIPGGENIMVDLRLTNVPSATGTLTLHVEDVAKEIPIGTIEA